MAAEGILQFDEWVENGRIKNLDAYVGEIFPNQYRVEYAMLKDIFKKRNCGRSLVVDVVIVFVFVNHAHVERHFSCIIGRDEHFCPVFPVGEQGASQ
ncbi:MAG: hypothetical protein LBJ58_00945 [Tannerellaceae bacterium]|jgi:hypothetical protein|nr:hypothetical protein [Tannerellaceae bacterium]